jgi:hypothetical protein
MTISSQLRTMRLRTSLLGTAGTAANRPSPVRSGTATTIWRAWPVPCSRPSATPRRPAHPGSPDRPLAGHPDAAQAVDADWGAGVQRTGNVDRRPAQDIVRQDRADRVPSPLQPGNRVVVDGGETHAEGHGEQQHRQPGHRHDGRAGPAADPIGSAAGELAAPTARALPPPPAPPATCAPLLLVDVGSWLRGGPSRTRTCGLRLVRAPLFQLSYGSAPGDPGQTSLTTATTAPSPCARTSAPEHARQRRRHLVGQPGHVGPPRSRLVEIRRYDDRLPRSDEPTGAARGLAQSAYQHR